MVTGKGKNATEYLTSILNEWLSRNPDVSYIISTNEGDLNSVSLEINTPLTPAQDSSLRECLSEYDSLFTVNIFSTIANAPEDCAGDGSSSMPDLQESDEYIETPTFFLSYIAPFLYSGLVFSLFAVSYLDTIRTEYPDTYEAIEKYLAGIYSFFDGE